MVRQIRAEDFTLGYLRKKERGRFNHHQQQGLPAIFQQWRVVGLWLPSCCHSLPLLTTNTVSSLLSSGLVLRRHHRRLPEYAIASLLADGWTFFTLPGSIADRVFSTNCSWVWEVYSSFIDVSCLWFAAIAFEELGNEMCFELIMNNWSSIQIMNNYCRGFWWILDLRARLLRR